MKVIIRDTPVELLEIAARAASSFLKDSAKIEWSFYDFEQGDVTIYRASVYRNKSSITVRAEYV